MENFFNELKNVRDADIHLDAIHKRIYSVDASIYEIEPVAVALPKTKEAIVQLLKVAKRHQVNVIPRGAGTGLAGGCLGKALILDLSKYLNHVLEINIEKEYAVVEPGIVQDKLNKTLFSFGYRLGPDTSTGNRATLGGMVGNNSAGARSFYYGKTVDCVLEIELALASGELLRFHPLDKHQLEKKLQEETQEGDIYRKVHQILSENKVEIDKHFPKIPRRVSGYNLDLVKYEGFFDLCKLIVGSEGTFGIVTEIKVAIRQKPKYCGLCIIHFHEMNEGFKSVPYLLNFKPIALEMIDDIILNTGLTAPSLKGQVTCIEGSPKIVFVAEFIGETLETVQERLTRFKEELIQNKIGYAHVILTDPQEMEGIWNIRKSGVGLLLSKKTYTRAIAFMEDFAVDPNNIFPFMDKFQKYMASIGKTAGMYGHVGVGCLHIRPYMDLRDPNELKLMEKMMLDMTDLCLEFNGIMSGEHGDGILRSWLTEKYFGPKLYQAFLGIKRAFDPENRMNPGKIVSALPFLENLRLDPETKFAKIETFLDFTTEGGFNLAVDLCNGNGACRKKEGVMCPSYQATLDEYDTTRARAQTLRAIVNGHVPKGDLTSPEVLDVLDLCLECKGCKKECPSLVDMAKIKAEVLYQYQEKHGYSFRSRLFGNISRLNSFMGPMSGFFNFFNDTYPVKWVLEWVGIAKERNLPRLSKQRFSAWFKNYKQKINGEKKQVVLFNDTYNEFNEPHIGMSAVKVLNHLGFEVIVPSFTCCGKPMISKGLLKEAKSLASKLLDQLAPFAEANIPIIGLEPSFLFAIKDDFQGLLGSEIKKITSHLTTFDEFMALHLPKSESLPKTVLVHGHCHQKASIGTKPTLEALKKFKSLDVKEIDSGCCGMAGSFGYEKEHYALSMKIGGLKLFPAVLAAGDDTVIVANGTSCRSQILQGTKRHAKHLAEALCENFKL
jgi:FAD/FMN-containing dehydrogenase/Fe-S oxidoreductase